MNERKIVVHLRPIYKDDAIVLMELNNNKLISDYVVGNPQNVSFDQQMAWMERLEHEKNTVRWMIDFDDQTVGTVILSSIDHSNATGNMNIKLLPQFHGRGIAKKALSVACDIAFDELNMFCLTANILSYNVASLMLFQKIGFRQDGVLRSRVIKNGKRCDLITLSFLKSERESRFNECVGNR